MIIPGAEEQLRQIEQGAKALIISSIVTAVATVIILFIMWRKFMK